MTESPQEAVEFIAPLNMNGLQGRMLRVPASGSSKAEILLVYGHHARLERWWGLVDNLRDYGNVTMPDLPGFGGMQSFHKIGQKPTIDTYADYLAAFIRLRYKRRRIAIVGISFGFVIATRMLQRYPDLAGKVDLLASLVGFMHYDDFLLKPYERRAARLAARIFSIPPMPLFLRYIWLNGPVIRSIYVRTPSGKKRLSAMDPVAGKAQLDYDVMLWQTNDVRSHWYTMYEFLGINNCGVKIDLPVWHVASMNDHFFDNDIVEQHMQVVFSEYHKALIDAKAHTPSMLADKTEMGVMLPDGLRQALADLS